jgi:hypothetical protein
MTDYKRYVLLSIYTLVYAVVSFDLIGAGHGTVFFLIPLLTWPLIIVAVILLPKTQKPLARLAFTLTMLLHLFVTFCLVSAYLLSGDNGRLLLVLRVNPYYSLFTAIWYLSGQTIIWASFLKSPREVPKLP